MYILDGPLRIELIVYLKLALANVGAHSLCTVSESGHVVLLQSIAARNFKNCCYYVLKLLKTCFLVCTAELVVWLN